MSPLPPELPPSVAQCLWSGALNPAIVLLPGIFFFSLEDQDLYSYRVYRPSPWLEASSPFMLLDPLQPGPLLVFWERKYKLKAVQPKILCWKFSFTSPNRPYLHCYSSPWKGFLLSRAFLFLHTCHPAPSQTTPAITIDPGGEQICSGPSHWPISLRDHQLKGEEFAIGRDFSRAEL